MVVARFAAVVGFLQDNRLTNRQLLKDGESPPGDFAIRTSDFTDDGNSVIKMG